MCHRFLAAAKDDFTCSSFACLDWFQPLHVIAVPCSRQRHGRVAFARLARTLWSSSLTQALCCKTKAKKVRHSWLAHISQSLKSPSGTICGGQFQRLCRRNSMTDTAQVRSRLAIRGTGGEHAVEHGVLMGRKRQSIGICSISEAWCRKTSTIIAFVPFALLGCCRSKLQQCGLARP